LGNNRAVNGRSACLGDSGRNTSAEQHVSSNIANARDCGVGYEESGACRNGLAKFTKYYYRGDPGCRSDYDEFAACRSDLAKFTKCYHRGDRDYRSDPDEFATCRNGLAEFTKSYRHGSVRF
jgi:hypothetical protein